jgi:prefoldin alpha subunit
MGERIMSQPQTVDLNTIMAQVEMLRERLAALELLIANVQDAITHVEAALKTLDAVSKYNEILVPGDGGFNTMIFASVQEKDKILYHIGGNVYAVLPREKVEDLLLKRLQILSKNLSELNRERENTAAQLAQLEYIIQVALAQARGGQQK